MSRPLDFPAVTSRFELGSPDGAGETVNKPKGKPREEQQQETGSQKTPAPVNESFSHPTATPNSNKVPETTEPRGRPDDPIQWVRDRIEDTVRVNAEREVVDDGNNAEPVLIARWSKYPHEAKEYPNVKAWIVKRASDRERNWRVRVTTKEDAEDLLRKYPDAAEDVVELEGTFVEGKALLKSRVPIMPLKKCEMPLYVFRAVHGKMPFGGIKCRSWGKFGTDGIRFQIYVERHLKWNARTLSPFLSVTCSIDKAKRQAALYRKEGFPDVKIIKIDMHDPAWNHPKARIFYAPKLLTELHRKYYVIPWYTVDEYLVEGEIPEAAAFREVSPVTLPDVPPSVNNWGDWKAPKGERARVRGYNFGF